MPVSPLPFDPPPDKNESEQEKEGTEDKGHGAEKEKDGDLDTEDTVMDGDLLAFGKVADLLYSGRLTGGEVETIQGHLNDRGIVLLLPSVPSTTGAVFNNSSEEFQKYLEEDGGNLPENVQRYLREGLPSDVRSLHLLNYQRDGSSSDVTEPFTRDGVGTLLPNISDGSEQSSLEPKPVKGFRKLPQQAALMAASIIGVLDASYLTYIKANDLAPICPTNGCDAVLSSPYAQVLGVPLPYIGLATYVTFLVLVLCTYLPKSFPKVRSLAELTIPNVATVMASFSSYLVFLLSFELQELCIYCLLSAAISFTLFGLTRGHQYEMERTSSWQTLSLGALTLSACAALYVSTSGLLVSAFADTPSGVSETTAALDETSKDTTTGIKRYSSRGASSRMMTSVGRPIASHSNALQISIAKHLRKVGARMYGAYWCTHCHDQKELFGQEAFAEIGYVECDRNGENSQVEMCKGSEVKGYPTWEVYGEKFTGVRTVEQLADLSGYSAKEDFRSPIVDIFDGQ